MKLIFDRTPMKSALYFSAVDIPVAGDILFIGYYSYDQQHLRKNVDKFF